MNIKLESKATVIRNRQILLMDCILFCFKKKEEEEEKKMQKSEAKICIKKI